MTGTAAHGQVSAPGAPAVAAEAQAAAARDERLRFTTSDDVPLEAWYYPAARSDDDVGPPAVVILLHELGGSHASVEPLARDLQANGIAVVAPNLRHHGGDSADIRSLKSTDFAKMAATAGSRVRAQARDRGDVETVRNWIKSQADAGRLDMSKVVVVGVGVGAAVAAHWIVADAAWPAIATGPQGGEVRGLVLVSPAWITRGFSIAPALGAERVKRDIPILVIGGSKDADAVKIYELLKKQRPDGWHEKRGQTFKQAPKLPEHTLPSLFLRQFETDLTGDRLAATMPRNQRQATSPSAAIQAFVGAVTSAER